MSGESSVLDPGSMVRERTPGGLAFRRLGTGQALVLLHGGYGSWLHWRRNLPALARQRLVFVPDLPGYGESPDVAADISVDGYVELVATALQQMVEAGTQTDLAGFSFGGLIAAGVAARLGARIRRLCLLAPSGFEKPTGRVLGQRPRRSFPPGEDGLGDFLRHNLLAMMLADPASLDAPAIEIHRANLARARFNNKHISWSNRLAGFLAKVQCPVQLIYGALDKTPFPSIDARVAIARAALPSLSFERVADAGHWVQYERSRETTELIMRFLGPDEPARAAHLN